MNRQSSKGRSPPSPTRTDAKRRKCARYHIDEASETTWVVKGGGWTAHVCDMSIGGIALLTSRPLDVGSTFNAKLHAAGASSPGQAVRLRVAHSEQRPDGKWLIGCAILETPGES